MKTTLKIATDKVKVESGLDDLQGSPVQANHGCAFSSACRCSCPSGRSRRPVHPEVRVPVRCMAPGHANVQLGEVSPAGPSSPHPRG